MFLRRHPERPKTEAKLEEEKEIDYSQEGLKGLKIKEKVWEKYAALPKAEEIEAREVGAKYQALPEAKKCKIGTVTATYEALPEAENCEVKEVIVKYHALRKAKNCRVEIVEAKDDAFTEAQNCEAGKVKVRKGPAFDGAEKCLIIEKVNAEKIGEDSLGVVVLGDIKGEVHPSVILMKERVGDNPKEVQKFFIEELRKTQQGKESIFDYLSLFNWEGDTLKEGEKVLKERYDRVIEKIGGLEELRKVLEELRKYNFYFLIDDNSKREEILFGFKRLTEEDKKALLGLNKYLSHIGLSHLEEVKDDIFQLFRLRSR